MELKNTHFQRRLKERFIVLQDYARLMFLTEIGLKNCVNDGHYSSSINECSQCELKKECQCLTKESIACMMEKDLNNVIKEMEVTKNYVERKTVHNIQEDGSCSCDSCLWLTEFDKTLFESVELTRSKLQNVVADIKLTTNKLKEFGL